MNESFKRINILSWNHYLFIFLILSFDSPEFSFFKSFELSANKQIQTKNSKFWINLISTKLKQLKSHVFLRTCSIVISIAFHPLQKSLVCPQVVSDLGWSTEKASQLFLLGESRLVGHTARLAGFLLPSVVYVLHCSNFTHI